MPIITIKNVTTDNISDLSKICVNPDDLNDLDYIKGVNEKTIWAEEMLKRWGSFAKIAYYNDDPAGFIQYEPVPNEQVISIHCTFVPRKEHWNKGIASKLLCSLIDDMTLPSPWFDGDRPLALITRTFPGGASGQLKSRDFFIKRGFKMVARKPDFLYLPIKEGFIYEPKRRRAKKYIPQDVDKGRAIIVCGSNWCPVTYAYFLKRMEKYIREVDENITIIWLDTTLNSDEIKKRNLDVGDCVVNARKIKAFVLDKERFQGEVRQVMSET
ncbi:MAG: GNAT family N-acetyltransferase [bacterium]